MTQREYDVQMIAINYEQKEMHEKYDAMQQELAGKVAEIDKQIFDLRKQIVDINLEKRRIAQERFRLDMEFKNRKHQWAVDHPKSSMEPEKAAAETFGHVVMEDNDNVAS